MPANTALWTTLIVLAVVCIVVYLINAIRCTHREQQARSSERAAALMVAIHQRQAANAAPSTPAPAQTATRTESAAAAVPTSAARIARRARFLTQSQRLLYMALRSALPDHIIMGNVRLIDLTDGTNDSTAIERSDRLRELLRERIDLLVCNADLVPVAALMIYDAGVPSAQQEALKVETLRELGIKYLRFRTDNLPRPTEIRSIVLG